MLDEKTYKSLFKMHYQSLCQYAFSINNDRSEAEDVVQEIFVQIWEGRASLNFEIDKAGTYMASMVKNNILQRRRKEKSFHITQNSNIQPSENVADNNNDRNYEDFLLLSRLYSSIRQLPSRCSHIFALSKIEGKTQAEISKELNISIKTIENQMTKAYKLLREELKDLL